MDEANEDTAEELLERGKALRAQAQALGQIAEIIREHAQKLMDQAERSARVLAANKTSRVK
jgi:hypothetical protein